MTAFLFIPSASQAGLARRVDLANIASLFTEVEESRPRRDLTHVARIALVVLVLLGAIGDTILVARPGSLASCVATTRPAVRAAPAPATVL